MCSRLYIDKVNERTTCVRRNNLVNLYMFLYFLVVHYQFRVHKDNVYFTLKFLLYLSRQTTSLHSFFQERQFLLFQTQVLKSNIQYNYFHNNNLLSFLF